MIFLLGEVAAEVVMMVVMFPLPGCPLPGAGFNIVVMIYFFDYQTCPKFKNCCRLALNYNRI